MSSPSHISIFKNTLLPLYRRLTKSGEYGWSGNYISWKDAASNSNGYEQQGILQMVKNATIKVKNGEAIYERDSVLFDKIHYSWPLLSALMWIAAKNKGTLSVIDFGGSLGSTYFQNKQFLKELQLVKWTIVEQPNFVECGSAHISDSILQFFPSIKEAVDARGKPDILLISCTLPYIERPYELIQQIFEHKIPYLLIDNTPFNYQHYDRITIQKIHPSIYLASYPCWFLDYNKVRQTLQQQYSLIEEYQNELSIYLDGHKIQYRGILAKLK